MCIYVLPTVAKKMGQLKRERVVLDFHHSCGSGNAFLSPQIYSWGKSSCAHFVLVSGLRS